MAAATTRWQHPGSVRQLPWPPSPPTFPARSCSWARPPRSAGSGKAIMIAEGLFDGLVNYRLPDRGPRSRCGRHELDRQRKCRTWSCPNGPPDSLGSGPWAARSPPVKARAATAAMAAISHRARGWRRRVAFIVLPQPAGLVAPSGIWRSRDVADDPSAGIWPSGVSRTVAVGSSVAEPARTASAPRPRFRWGWS